ncbi:glycosyltransferase [Ructibacterium gallinarum]|uniref:Glycosyltransferase n=1 Tax=Ructibacterium gallinarum TaxID=2779355 RepID=A0A9D5R7L7_9FIRM|nr:glycosyltransferase [Ructibacterium gallinarum]MBE5039341.1 glycosyltransferase [Ructibacterium gallinarum]
MAQETVVYIGGFELPDKNAAAHRVISNAKILSEIGYRVVFIDIDRKCRSTVCQKNIPCQGFERWSRGCSIHRFVSIDAFKKIYQNDSSIKWVIAYDFPSVALYRLLRFCKKRNISVIADCTEWYGCQGCNIVSKILRGIDSYLRMNVIHPKLDGMIVISSYLKKYYREKLPVALIPPLVDMEEGKWKKKLVDDQPFLQLVYAGSPGRSKDQLHKVVLGLTKVDQNFVFQIIGLTKAEYLKNHPEDEINLKELDKKVLFLGRIPHLQVIDAIKKADFSIFYRDITRVTMAGFPTKFVESISCGTPVITNRTSDLENYLVNGKNGFFLEGEIETSLPQILNQDMSALKDIKKNVNRNMFDYHGYIDEMQKIFIKLGEDL